MAIGLTAEPRASPAIKVSAADLTGTVWPVLDRSTSFACSVRDFGARDIRRLKRAGVAMSRPFAFVMLNCCSVNGCAKDSHRSTESFINDRDLQLTTSV